MKKPPTRTSYKLTGPVKIVAGLVLEIDYLKKPFWANSLLLIPESKDFSFIEKYWF